MTKEEIIRLPGVVNVFQKIYFNQSICNICGLPWKACGSVYINITDSFGVFYICPYCFRTKSLKDVLEASANGYLEQYQSIPNHKDRDDFIETHDLQKILERTMEKYIEIHKNDYK